MHMRGLPCLHGQHGWKREAPKQLIHFPYIPQRSLVPAAVNTVIETLTQVLTYLEKAVCKRAHT